MAHCTLFTVESVQSVQSVKSIHPIQSQQSQHAQRSIWSMQSNQWPNITNKYGQIDHQYLWTKRPFIIQNYFWMWVCDVAYLGFEIIYSIVGEVFQTRSNEMTQVKDSIALIIFASGSILCLTPLHWLLVSPKTTQFVRIDAPLRTIRVSIQD